MKINISGTREEMGRKAAETAAASIREAMFRNGKCNLIVATGQSQFEMLAVLVKLPVDWTKVTVFHLDEYIGLPMSHPASFRKYLKERFHDKVPQLKMFNYVDGENPDPESECRRLEDVLKKAGTVDVACVGIGENGHLAFNDPPADFQTKKAYLVLKLDEACRRQQVGEGWFASLGKVPSHAISMSINKIMESLNVICTVPDMRKAKAVRDTLEGPVTNMVPASILQKHPQCQMFLDKEAASSLKQS